MHVHFTVFVYMSVKNSTNVKREREKKWEEMREKKVVKDAQNVKKKGFPSEAFGAFGSLMTDDPKSPLAAMDAVGSG